MEAASDIKVPLALYLLHQVEAGAVKTDDQVALQDSDFMGGTGSLDHSASAGDKFAVGDLLRLMIQQSDNTAWQALMRVLGASSIDAYAASIGAPDCHQVDDNCTAREAGLMLAGLYKGKLLKPDDTALLILLLENTAYNDRLNYFLGGLTVAHKTGADGGVMNDVGIVYAPGGPFLISVFSQTDTGTVQPIRDVARAALRYYSTR
jgi:beta-lactamase class A